MDNIYLDIETIPNFDVEDYVKRVSVSAPKNYKDSEKIEAYINERKKTIFHDVAKDASLSPIHGKIVCIGLIVNETEHCFVGDELEIINELIKELKFSNSHMLYTFNGKAFDVPFINIRAKINGIQQYVIRAVGRYDQSYHFDVLEYVTSFGTIGRGNKYLKHTQKNVAGAFGMPTNDLDGSCVYPFYLNGDLDKIEKYCLSDIRELKELVDNKLRVVDNAKIINFLKG